MPRSPSYGWKPAKLQVLSRIGPETLRGYRLRESLKKNVLRYKIQWVPRVRRARTATVIVIFVLAWAPTVNTSDGTLPVDPNPRVIAGVARCKLPLWFGSAKLSLTVVVDPHTEWKLHRSAKVDVIAKAVIPASLAQLIIDLPGRMESLGIAALQTDLRVEGGTPSSIRIVDRTQTYDLDRNDDGKAEDVLITMRAPTQTITNDGDPWVGFSIEHFATELEDLPLIKDLVMSDTKPPSTARRPCKLASETVRFRVAE